MKKRISLILAALLLVAAIFGGVYASAEEPATEAAPTMKIKGAALILGNSVDIQYIAELDGIEASDVKLLVWDSVPSEYAYGTQKYTVSYINGDTLTSGGVTYPYFRFTNAGAKMMTKDYYTVLYATTDEGAIYSSPVKYSILNYAYNKLGKTGTVTTNEKLKNLLSGMLEYGALAQDYLGYETDRLANDDFYQVKVSGGTIDDGFKTGLYLEGDTVTVTAQNENENGDIFIGWTDASGNLISYEKNTKITVGTQNAAYVATYSDYSEGLVYEENDDGNYSITGIGNCEDTDLIIPLMYNGKAVTRIGASAFENCTNIKSVSIPSSIISIEANAFYGCSSLEFVSGCEAVQVYGESAFYKCTNLLSANISDACVQIEKKCFYGNTKMSITISPTNLTKIGSGAIQSAKEIIWNDANYSSWTFKVAEGTARIWPYLPGDIGQYHYRTVKNQTFTVKLNANTASKIIRSSKEYDTNVYYNSDWGYYKLPVAAGDYELVRN